jgi:4-hydroxybenzoate polyprenyltransferase
VVNDLLDLAADRDHPEKRRRPFASGQLPLAWGPPMAGTLVVISLLIAWLTLPWSFLVVLATYTTATLAYSFLVKSRLMADVLLLASLYTLRILAGSQATGIQMTEWILGFSLFFFLSLAFVKRYVELDRSESLAPKEKLKGRGYRRSDLSLVENLGVCSGYLSLVIFALYIKSPEVQALYHHPDFLWGVCMILIYWISRLWFLAKRRELWGDPVLFAVQDPHSLVLGVLTAILIFAGALLPRWGQEPRQIEAGPKAGISAGEVPNRQG